MNIPESMLSMLTDEQKKAVESASSPEELLALARAQGYELSPEQLEAVSGGDYGWCNVVSCSDHCPVFCIGHGR